MNCPGCAAAMTAITLAGHVGTTVDVDMCNSCQAFWFDRHESLQLSPGSILELFTLIAKHSSSDRSVLSSVLRCPRCGIQLLSTHDAQRDTKFQYWRCDNEHGRFITFVDFLREKNFIHPMTPRQLEELKQNIRVITCPNCGGPIDLTTASACSHCGSAVSFLDVWPGNRPR